jgi:hypothetical protein
MIFVCGCTNQKASTATAIPSQTSFHTAAPTNTPPGVTTASVTVKPPTPSATLPDFTATHRPSFTPTWTPLPTLPPEEAQRMVDKLLSANSYCKLPCIGGITPGMNSYAEAIAFFSRVAREVRYYVPTSAWIFYQPTVLHPFENYGPLIRLMPSAPESKELGAIITEWYEYQVTDFLADYGKPEEVYLSLTEYEPGSLTDGFEMLLHYPDQGFMAVYLGSSMRTGKELKICPVEPVLSPVSLLSWNPARKGSFEEIAVRYEFFSEKSVANYRPLNTYGMTVDEFYEQFKFPKDRIPCFKIKSPWAENP